MCLRRAKPWTIPFKNLGLAGPRSRGGSTCDAKNLVGPTTFPASSAFRDLTASPEVGRSGCTPFLGAARLESCARHPCYQQSRGRNYPPLPVIKALAWDRLGTAVTDHGI